MGLNHERIVIYETNDCATFLHWVHITAEAAPSSRGGLTDIILRGQITKVRGEPSRDVYKGTFWFPYRALPDGRMGDCVYTLNDIVDDRDPHDPFDAGAEVEDHLTSIYDHLQTDGPTTHIVSMIRAGASSEVCVRPRVNA